MIKMNNLCLLLGEIIEHGEAILEAAKEMLLTSDLNIHAISSLIGFDNVAEPIPLI